MRRVLSFLKKLFRVCDHDYMFMELIHESNIRTGHAHWSNVYSCKKCGKYQTVELDI